MKKTTIIAAAMALLLHASCTDDTLPWTPDDAQADGVAFGISVVEQADLIYEYGRTRAAAGEPMLDSATVAANTFGAHPLEGDNAWGMNVHRMPLPMVGIHPGTASTDPEQAATRAPLSEIASGDLLFHDSLTIWGIVYDKEGSKRNLFNKTLLKKVRGWRSSVHWPYDDKGFMTFCAISPALESVDLQQVGELEYDKEAGTLTLPTFKYQVPEEPGSQRDLLFGVSEEIDVTAGPQPGWGGSGKGYYQDEAEGEKFQHLGQDDKVIALTFRHILTAVRFAQGKMPEGIHIKRILLTGIVNAGTFQPQDGNGTWKLVESSPSNYTIYPDKAITDYSPSENVYIDGDSVLFLMPQTLKKDAKLQVVLTVDAEGKEPKTERTLTCSLSDDVWRPGYTVTYKITIGELKDDYYLVLDTGTGTGDTTIPKDGTADNEQKWSSGANTHETSNAATEGSFIIHSFRNAKDYSKGESKGINVHHSAAWQLTGFSWTGEDSYLPANCPAWLTAITGWTISGTTVGATAGEQTPADSKGQATVSYTIASQTMAYSSTHSTVLGHNTPVDGFDLSTNQPDGTDKGTSKPQETANSYIVNASGTYRIPAIYGNGIQNGAVLDLTTNEVFLDHNGKPIHYANIFKQINSYKPTVTTEHIIEAYKMKDDVNAENPSELTAEITPTAYEALTDEQKELYEVKTEKWRKTTETIVYPRDYQEGGTTKNALSEELIWQDAEGLFIAETGNIDLVGFDKDSDTGYGHLRFQVSTKPKPGNCVIALKGRKRTDTTVADYSDRECTTIIGSPTTTSTLSEPETLWTWHIWLTDEVYPNTLLEIDPAGITNDDHTKETKRKSIDELYASYYDGSKIVSLLNADGTSSGLRLLPANLGWVPDDDAFGIYQPREIWVEIVQPVTGVEPENYNRIHFCIRQEAKQAPVSGTCTMYQWGRPTALPMVNMIGGAERTIYGPTGSASITDDFQEEQVAPSEATQAAIREATKLIRNSSNGKFWWADAPTLHDYWATTKTLYDPCPPGFRTPELNVFAWLTTETELKLTSNLNMWDGEIEALKGGYFYALKHTSLPVSAADRYKQKLFIPSTCYYSNNESKEGRALTKWFVTEDPSSAVMWTTDGKDEEKGGVFYLLVTGKVLAPESDPYCNLHAVRPVSTP